VLSASEARHLEPGLADHVRAALYCPLDGIADHTATTRAYATAAAGAGADVREHTTVKSVASNGDGASVTLADGTTLHAERGVFVLVNSYARQLLAQSFDLDLPVWRMVPQVMLARPRGGYRPDHLIGHFTRALAVKVLPDGLTMISGGRFGTWDPTGDRGVAGWGEAASNLEDAAAVLPALGGAQIVDVDAARPESFASDAVPVVDLVPGTRSVYFGTGWSGHGFAIAPALAESLVHWAHTGTRPIELEPFRLHRWQSVTAELTGS
jgi:sarcosine oxidase subunit beta